MEKLTIYHMLRIAHALGVDLFKAAMSHKLKEKKLPNNYYRNYYQSESDNLFDDLVVLGFAKKDRSMDLPYYYVTKEGIKAFVDRYNEMVKYVSPKDRDIDYLRRRINWYCEWAGYRFGEDNSEHIISAYLNYWVKGYYVSHTTKDTINHFKTELRSYHKKGLLAA